MVIKSVTTIDLAQLTAVWGGCRVPAGTVDTVLSYCHYSLNDRTLADMVPYLQGKHVGIINASALSMGLLTDQVTVHRLSVTLLSHYFTWLIAD